MSWPASAQALADARALILAHREDAIVIACDHDVDGLASAVLVCRTLARVGANAEIVPVGRGQHIHERSYRDALRARAAALYIVTDMGSRGEPIGLQAPTLVIDHHASDAFPPDARVVSAAKHEPVAPTSYLAYALLEPLAPIDDLAWLALLGSEADLGSAASMGALPAWRAQHRRKDVTEAIALLNAPRRAAAHDVATALRVLAAADSPRAIAAGTSADVARLREARSEVAHEVQRCMRVPPRMIGDVALIRIRSQAQVHPLVAVRWKARLAGKIVLVANEDFLPGRVNFVVRSTRKLDLMAWLRSLPVGEVSDDFARGHPAATGGSLDHAQFSRLLTAIAAGLSLETQESAMSDRIGEQFAEQLHALEETRDTTSLVELFSDDVELRRAAQNREYTGLDGAREFWEEYLRMFPEVATTFDAVMQADGRAALEWHSTCKLESGAEVSYRGCTVIESEGGRVKRLRTYYDSAAVLGNRPNAA